MHTSDLQTPPKGWRITHEFDETPREDGATGPCYLRAFRDGQERILGGLYPTREPSIDDDWTDGLALTTPDDFARAKSHLRTDANCSLTAIVMAIAYLRVSGLKKVPGQVLVPQDLHPWSVRARIDTTRPDLTQRVYVMAAEQRAAVYAGAQRITELALASGEAERLN